ncbi:uncharacterized protein rab44 isoform X2 [Stigmatopora argus]
MPGGKRRFGSHRRVGQRVEMPEDLFVTDQPSVLQPDENKGSFNILPNESQVTLESQNRISSKQQSSRRKLGSNRQSKRRGVEQFTVESYHKPTEDIEDASAEKIQTQMMQKPGSSSEDYDSLYGTHLYSAYTPGDTSEALIPGYPDEEELHQPINSDLHSAQDGGEMDSKWDSDSCEKLENPDKLWPDKLDFQTMSECVLIDTEIETVNKDPTQPNKFLGDILNFDSMETSFLANKKDGPASTNRYNEIAQIKKNVEEPNHPSAIDNLSANEEHEPSDFSHVRGSQLPHQIQIKELKSSQFDQIGLPKNVEHDKNLGASLENVNDEIIDNTAQDIGSGGDDTDRIKEERFTMEAVENTQLTDNIDTCPVGEISVPDQINADLNSTEPQLQKKLEISSEMLYEILSTVKSETKVGEENETFSPLSQNENLDDAIELDMPRKSLNEGGETMCNVVAAIISPPKADEQKLHSQVRAAEHKHKDLIKKAQLEEYPIKNSDILITGSTGNDNIGIIEILEAHRSNLSSINCLDSGLNPEDNLKGPPMKEDTTKVSKQIFKNEHASDLSKTRINTEKTDPTKSQELDIDIKEMFEQSAKEVSSAMMVSEFTSSVQSENSLVFDSQSNDNNVSADEQTDSVSQVAKTFKIETTALENLEIRGLYNSDTFQEENISEFVRGNEHAVSPPSKKMPEEKELSIVESEIMDGDFNESPASFAGQSLANAEVPNATPEVCTSQSCINEHVKIRHQAAISPPKADVSRDDELTDLHTKQDTAVQQPDEVLVKGAKLLDTNQIRVCEILIDQHQGDVDKNTGIVNDILETHASKLSLMNSFDLGLTPRDNAKEVPMKDYASDSMSKWVETGRTETTQSQVKENEMKDELMKSESSQSVEPEREIFDFQSDDNNTSADEQTDSITDVRIRRKLGSSRRDKRRHIMVFADELYTDSGFIESNTHSQILHEQSSATKVSGSVEAPVVQSKTKSVVENVQTDFLNHPLSDAKLSIATLEMCTSKGGLKKDTEYSEAKATISSTKAEIPTDEQHEHASFFEVIDAPYPNFILNDELQSIETERNEDLVIFDPALNLNLKVITKETHNETTDDAAGNRNNEKDPPEDKLTFTIEIPKMENTQKNSLNKDENVQYGPEKGINLLPQEEKEEKCEQVSISGGNSSQFWKSDINKTLKQKLDVNSLNHFDDPTTELLQMEPLVELESYKELNMQETQNIWNKVSQEPKDETVEALETQLTTSDDSISPNSDKYDVGKTNSHRAVPDVQCSNTLVEESDERFQAKTISLNEESLENILETEKDDQGKCVEEIPDNSEKTGQVNESLTPSKKRKMGSTRRSWINKKHEAEIHREHDRGDLENVGAMEDLQQTEAILSQRTKYSLEKEQEFNTAEVVQDTGGVMTTFSEKAMQIQNEHDVNGAHRFASQVVDVRGNDQDVAHSTETYRPDQDPDYKVHHVSSQYSESQESEFLSKATGHEASEIEGQPTTQILGGEHINEQPNIHGVNTESDKNVKSPTLKDKKRIGSKRKNLGTLAKGDLELKLNLSKGEPVTALVHGVLTERACQSDDKELKHESSEPNKEHTGDPPSAIPAHDTGGENIISEYRIQDDTMETKSIAAKPDGLSELEVRVRKRKMGSHRKSRVQQTHVKPNEAGKLQTEPVTASTTHHLADDIIQGAEELQVNGDNMRPSSNISKSVRLHATHDVTPSQILRDRVHQPPDTWNVPHGKSTNLNPYNVIMVGDSCVGKTSFMKRAQNGKFFPDLPASAGLDTCLWTVVVDGKTVVLQLWDTAGQERFRSITKQIFHRAHAFLLMYDITSSQSFAAVNYWATCIQQGTVENVPVLLIGNKNDSAARQVTIEEGQNVAKEFEMDCMECSAVNGDNVIQSLEAVARLLTQKDDRREETLVLHKETPKKKSGCC